MTEYKSGYGLIVGVGNDLPGTVTDARGIYEVLTDPKRGNYSPERLKLITSEEATRKGILEALHWLVEKSESHHHVILYYSGHGGYLSKEDQYFLVPFDFDSNRKEDTWIKSEEFAELLEAIKSRRILILLDCCHAAGVDTKEDEHVVEQQKIKEEEKLDNPVFFTKKFGLGDRNYVISSCRENEKSYMLKGDRYSLFTQCLIEALEGTGLEDQRSRFIQLVDVIDYVFTEVPKRSKDLQHPYINKMGGIEDYFPISEVPEEKRQMFIDWFNKVKDDPKLDETIKKFENRMDDLELKLEKLNAKKEAFISEEKEIIDFLKEKSRLGERLKKIRG